MTLHPRSLSSIPEMTASVARTSFPKGNPYMKMRDELGVLYEDTDFLSPEWLLIRLGEKQQYKK
jgi:transposase